MSDKKNKRTLGQRLRDKYRLIVFNDNTFEAVLMFRLSRLNLLSIIGSAVILLIIGVSILIAFTPLREFIPGYPDADMRRNIILNAVRIDSLEQQLEIKSQYINNINHIISGHIPHMENKNADTVKISKPVQFSKSVSDSLLRHQIEEEERFNLADNTQVRTGLGLSSIHFFTPVKGVVTNPFNASMEHYGTDIVAAPNEVVKATLNGVVILATWTLETGYIIQIQHPNNIISVYKHNANLLKKEGDVVKAGDPIAIIGNSGELSTGPHLHFELWHNGLPLNPEDYIIF